MIKKTTIHEIARELNFTPETVSKALNDNTRIGLETKRLVNEKSLELNYQQKKIASSLRSGKRHTFGVIIHSAQMNFFGSVVHGIQMLAICKGYNVVLYQTEETCILEKKAIKTFLSARVGDWLPWPKKRLILVISKNCKKAIFHRFFSSTGKIEFTKSAIPNLITESLS